MINYLIQVTICWGLFYLLYATWLGKETFFNTNRWYLLTTLFAGLFIPLIEFQFTSGQQFELLNPAYYLETITVTAQALETNLQEIVITPVNESWSIQLVLISIYWLGVLFFASRFIYGMSQIIRLAYQGKITRKSHYFLVETNTVHLPFSFMDYLFWSKEVVFEKEENEKILRHELNHINGKHSIDVLITELLCIFLWCSPFIFLYKNALKNIHEYLADEAVLKDTPTKKYGQLLLRQSQSGLQIAQANNFIHSQLKKRILMMTRSKSQQYALLKYTAILPLALILFFSISAKNSFADIPKTAIDQSIVTDSIPPTAGTDEIFQVVEEMPRFEGCEDLPIAERKNCADQKMLQHIYTNIKYPAEARKSGTEGTIVVSFIIEKDGSISNPDILRSIGNGCDEEVLRVVNSMPSFIPGKQRGENVRVKFNLPVKFKLEGGASKEKELDNNLSEIRKKVFPYGVLMILDGVQINTEQNIDPSQIEDIKVLKGEEAIAKYGEKGKNGVLLINTKKKAINKIGQSQENIPPSSPVPVDDELFINVEEMPLFPGTSDRETSNKELMTFIFTNLKYPKEAKESAIEGTVVVSFVITKEGTVENPKILRSIGGGTNEEVLKVVNLMNTDLDPWTPGKQGGKAVNVQFNLPVKFKLDSSTSSDKKVSEKKAAEREQPAVDQNSDFEKVDVYPNPTNGTINMNLYSKNDAPTTITIRDNTGKQLYQKVFNGHEIKVTDLELKSAANGILLLSFEQDGKVFTREVVLQK
ncbi:MAG: TonB family protein [Saprospiraceae bacterium]|jgi:TonB family protein